ncbi:MAG: hypothetical protein ACLUJR_12340 [Mediterraneibacter gnavus]
MAQINRDRIAGMNIHYLYYSLPYFLDAQQKLGVKTIELWAGAPHFFGQYVLLGLYKSTALEVESRGMQVKILTPENCTYQYQFAACGSRSFMKKALHILPIALKAGEELGIETMAINSGWGYWNEDREEAWKRSREMLSRLADEAAKTQY